MVVKSSGRREPFERAKLERGVQRALEKRPVSQGQIELIISEIEDEAAVAGMPGFEIESRQIGEMVLKRLYHTDRVAYVRFASVYRNFENVDGFIREIEELSRWSEGKDPPAGTKPPAEN